MVELAYALGFACHALAAMLATWRLTELLVFDQLTAPLRRRLGWYVLSCSRCTSVWAGGFATCALWFAPWANWPFALSWLWLWLRDVRGGSATTYQPQREASMTDKEWTKIVNQMAAQLAQANGNALVLSVQLESARERIAELEAQLGGVAETNGHLPVAEAAAQG